MKKDITTKETVKTIVEDISRYILGFVISKVVFLDKELSRIEKREADIVVKCEIDGKEEILHIEIQNNNDSKMPIRMMRYYTDIKTLYPKIPVRRYLIYIGKRKCSIKDRIDEEDEFFRYNLIDMHKIDCEKFLKMDTPDALVLSILCDFKGRDEKDIIKYILTRLRELTEDDAYQLNKYMLILETLSTNRNLQDKVKEVEKMLRDIRLEDLPSFQIAKERLLRDINIEELPSFQIAKERVEERAKREGKLEGKLETAITMIKEFGLSVKDVSDKLKLPLDEINRYLEKKDKP